jgi:hypothetical protein
MDEHNTKLIYMPLIHMGWMSASRPGRFTSGEKSFQSHQAVGFTQSLTEMSTRSERMLFLGSGAQPVRKANNLLTDCLDNVGS